MSTTSNVQYFINQATEALKEMLGIEKLPQSMVSHDRPFLNDIAQGKWRNTLNPANTNISYLPVVGFPPNYSWSDKNRKFKTNFIRYPFLKQLRSQSLQLRQVETIDKSAYVPDKDFKLRPSRNRLQLFDDIRSFKSSSLKPIPSPEAKGSGMFAQMKNAFSSAFGGVKEALGFDSWPQSQTDHEQRYLNDIVRGSWKPLNKVETVERMMPVVGFPTGYNMYAGLKFKTKGSRSPPYLKEIRRGKKLRHVQSRVEKKGFAAYLKDWKMSKPTNRQQLLLSIRQFDRSRLKQTESTLGSSNLFSKAKQYVNDQLDNAKEMLGMNTYPQSTTEHTARYLNDIAIGNWKRLNHVSEVRESQPVIGQQWKEPADRSLLLEEVQKGCDLKHVQTVENQLVIEPGYIVKQGGEERKALLDNIRGFENENLHHIGSS